MPTDVGCEEEAAEPFATSLSNGARTRLAATTLRFALGRADPETGDDEPEPGGAVDDLRKSFSGPPDWVGDDGPLVGHFLTLGHDEPPGDYEVEDMVDALHRTASTAVTEGDLESPVDGEMGENVVRRRLAGLFPDASDEAAEGLLTRNHEAAVLRLGMEDAGYDDPVEFVDEIALARVELDRIESEPSLTERLDERVAAARAAVSDTLRPTDEAGEADQREP